jgi:uncharacterized RDD family membrane protein YckC/Tfp pilus assembly major pilin PilA
MHGESSGPTANRYAVSPAIAIQSEGASTGEIPYAGFWRRAGAWIIDYIIVTIVARLVLVLLATGSKPGGGYTFLVLLGSAAFSILYYALLESSGMQATLGKKALDIKVTDLQGEQISFLRALGRVFAHIISYFTLGVGFAMAVFTDRRQTLHDKIAGTLVVRRVESPEDIAAADVAPPAPLWQSIVAVLGLLLFGPTGIGLVAAIAIPAYQSYTIRSQIAQGLVVAQPFQTAIVAAAAAGMPFNSIDSSKLVVSLPDSAKYVNSVRVVQGAIDIEYGRSAHKSIRGGHLILVPGLRGDQVQWICGQATPPADVTLVGPDYGKYTNIPNQLLPIACRSDGGSGQHHQ